MAERLTPEELKAMQERLKQAARAEQSVSLWAIVAMLGDEIDTRSNADTPSVAIERKSLPVPDRTERPRKVSAMYFGLSLPDAVYKCLEMGGVAQSPVEIWTALHAAGFESVHHDPAHAVRTALMKRSKRHGDVLLVGRGKWDLKSRYTEAELVEIEANLGGMPARDHASHREQTKLGMLQARARGSRVGPTQKVDVVVAEKMFRNGATVEEVRRHFDLKSRQAVYRYFDGKTVEQLRNEGPIKEIPQKPNLRVVDSEDKPKGDRQMRSEIRESEAK